MPPARAPRRPALLLVLAAACVPLAVAPALASTPLLPSIRGSAHPTNPSVLREAAVSAALLGGAFALDHTVRPGWSDQGGGRFVEEPGETFGGATLLVGVTLGLGAEGAAFHHPSAFRTAKELAWAGAGATIAVTALKEVTRRERPDGSDRLSFPSGHATAAFAAATVVARERGGAIGWLAYGAAATAGYARVADRHHYLSDVVAGAILGRLIGRLVTRGPSTESAAPAVR
ncbi:MAG TPA: phosphatase PAP2 family protein [Candidatus Eisenbacteria bacterium]